MENLNAMNRVDPDVPRKEYLRSLKAKKEEIRQLLAECKTSSSPAASPARDAHARSPARASPASSRGSPTRRSRARDSGRGEQTHLYGEQARRLVHERTKAKRRHNDQGYGSDGNESPEAGAGAETKAEATGAVKNGVKVDGNGIQTQHSIRRRAAWEEPGLSSTPSSPTPSAAWHGTDEEHHRRQEAAGVVQMPTPPRASASAQSGKLSSLVHFLDQIEQDDEPVDIAACAGAVPERPAASSGLNSGGNQGPDRGYEHNASAQRHWQCDQGAAPHRGGECGAAVDVNIDDDVGGDGEGDGGGGRDDAAAAAAYSNVKGRLAAMAVELEGKQQTIDLLKRAKVKEARQLRRQGAAELAEVKAEAEAQRQQLEEALSRQLKFVDELLKDKKALQAQVQSMADEMAAAAVAAEEEAEAVRVRAREEAADAKRAWDSAERARREKWAEAKERDIKRNTIKGLEPEVQRILSKHKDDLRELRQRNEAEVAQAREQAAADAHAAALAAAEQAQARARAEAQVEVDSLRRRLDAAESSHEKALRAAREQAAAAMGAERAKIEASALEREARLEARAQSREHAMKRQQKELIAQHREELEQARRSCQDEARAAELRHAGEARQWQARERDRIEEEARQSESAMRARLEAERDEQLRGVIERLQQEAEEKRASIKARADREAEELRRAHAEELRSAKEAEAVWIDKYTAVKAQHGSLQASAQRDASRSEAVAQRAQASEERAAALSRELEAARSELRAAQRETDETSSGAQKLHAALAKAEARAAAAERTAEQCVRNAESARMETERTVEALHSRVAAAVGKKDAAAQKLTRELADARMRLAAAQRQLEEQRQLLADVDIDDEVDAE